MHAGFTHGDSSVAGCIKSTRPGNTVELAHTSARQIEVLEFDGRQVKPAHRDLRTARDLLSAQLDSSGRDPVYEEALCTFLPVQI